MYDAAQQQGVCKAKNRARRENKQTNRNCGMDEQKKNLQNNTKPRKYNMMVTYKESLNFGSLRLGKRIHL